MVACCLQGSRLDLKNHIMEQQLEHTSMIAEKMSLMENKIDMIHATSTAIEQRQDTLGNQANNYRENLSSLNNDLATLRATFERVQNKTHEVPESARPAQEPLGATRPDLSADKLKEIISRLSKLEEQVKVMQVRERHVLGRGQVNQHLSCNHNS